MPWNSGVKQQLDDRIRTVESAFKLAVMPNHSDRNKALAIVHNAVASDTIVAAYVRDNYIDRLREVVARSFLPNVGGLASKILTMISLPSVIQN
jgi:hypothetical protein